MKLRNQLLALVCLLAFIGLGFLYFRAWVVRKPFGVILLVGDGMNTGTLAAARLFEGGAGRRLAVERMPQLALLTNASEDCAVPDLAAATSALATGQLVRNGSVSLSDSGKPLATLVDLARKEGRAVGLVTNGSLTGPGAAAFYAHGAAEDDFARALVDAGLDVALGGGAADFSSPEGPNLIPEILKDGVQIIRSRRELEELGGFRESPLLGLFAERSLASMADDGLDTRVPALPDMVRRAIEFLQYNRNGYLLIVDASLITELAQRNDSEGVLRETIQFDESLAQAVRYAGEESLIVATGRLVTGGMALNGYPLREDHGVALLGTNAAGQPNIVWGTGPNGPRDDIANRPSSDPAAFWTVEALNIAEDVIAVGTGPGSDALKGYRSLTDVFEVLQPHL